MSFFLSKQPRKIENVFLELENFFPQSILWADEEIYDFEKEQFKTTNQASYLRQQKFFEHTFSSFIGKLINHINNQFSQLNSIQIISFIQNQKEFYNTHLPNIRKKKLYEGYLIYNIAGGNPEVLQQKYDLSNNEKEVLKLAFDKYSDAYSYLYQSINDLFNIYSGIIPSKNQLKTAKKGFKSILQPNQIELLFNQLKGKYIAGKSNPEHFKAIFKDENLPENFEKIEWLKSIPLFCCLMFGYEIEYENKMISFNGIIEKNTEHIYKRTVDYFSFGMKKVTNKTLSEKVSKLSNVNPPQNFNSLFEIIKTVQNSTV